ncbi:MAG TPA: hypothetical protein VF103_02315, partial [Polyangiaceae bacterium]
CESPPCASVFVRETDICCFSDADCAGVSGACTGYGGALGQCLLPAVGNESYTLATTEYLADGGGRLFGRLPELDGTRTAGGLREAATEALRESEPCADVSADCASGCAAALVARSREICDDRGAACPRSVEACARAVALCRELPCLDERAGAVRDARVRIEAP